MASKPPKSKGKRPKTSTAPSQAPRPRKAKASGPKGQMPMHSLATDWLRLLKDPCNGKITRPCYTGVDAGYLIRTVDVVIPFIGRPTSFGTSGASAPLDYMLQYTPFNLSTTTGLITGGAQRGGFLNNTPDITVPGLNAQGITNFISTSTSVRAYRSVACCLKWIPDGPYGGRQGTVGLFSTPNIQFTNTQTGLSGQTVLPLCGDVVSNGSMEHEVRWLPSNSDESFTTIGASSQVGVGTVGIMLSNIDGTIGTDPSKIFPNGRIEIVTVWEWQPSASTGDVALNIQTPLPFTSQQVMSTIGDMAGFLYGGMARAMHAGGYAAGQRLLTAGVSALTRRSPALLIRN